MKTTVNLYDFRQAFNDMGRGEQFSYDGLEILFDYLEQLGEDIGEEIELDVIALCCEYAEEDHKAIADNYNIDIADCDFEDGLDRVIAYLEDEGVYIGHTKGFDIVYRQF